MQFDTYNLRNDADFCVPLFKGVNWVPVNVLGRTHYTDVQIRSFANYSAEEKKEIITCAYEAIQMLQLNDFTFHEDNLSTHAKNISWAFFVDGKTVVSRNEGCCASIANYITYLLQGKYDEVGVISILPSSGLGHAVNYIKHANTWYILDATAFLSAYREYICSETGCKMDYFKSKILTGVFLQVDSLENFIAFYTTYIGRVKHRVFLFCRHYGEIHWAGIRENQFAGIDTFWPIKETSIIGKLPINMTVNLISAPYQPF